MTPRLTDKLDKLSIFYNIKVKIFFIKKLLAIDDFCNEFFKNNSFASIFVQVVPTLVFADQNNPKLPSLFEKLRSAGNVKDARGYEYQIMQIWGKSGDKEIDQRMSWGSTAMREGSFQEALEIFTAITEKKPNFSEGWNMHTTILFFMDRHKESLESVKRTLALEPRHFGALAGKGLMYAHQERLNEALEIFETAKKIYPLHSRINQRIQQMQLLIKVKEGLKEKAI